VEFARRSAAGHGLDGFDVVCGDAGITDSYAGAGPAHVVLACGIFGNITDDAIAITVAALPGLCERQAVVIWTRHRMPPDITGTIRSWFDDAGFVEVGFDGSDDMFPIAVGVHRLVGGGQSMGEPKRLFKFADEVSKIHLQRY
jgi:hypothetical protein